MACEMQKVVVVGGVAGGATFAARLRRLSEHVQIVMLERGRYISFANCGLPYHIGKVIPERERLLLQTPEGMRKRYNIDVRTRHEALSIDRHNKKLLVRNLDTGEEYEEPYDVLVLSPGAKPLKPPLPGIDHPRIKTLRDIEDMDGIIHELDRLQHAQISVVGGGFIGLEMAENLQALGHHISIIEMADQVMPQLDRELASILHSHLREKGVRLVLSDRVSSFEPDGEGVRLNLSSGETVQADFVLLSMGVRPESQLAVEAGLESGPRRGILVDNTLRTVDPSIYAVGDAVEIAMEDGSITWTPLAGPANRQARLLADRLCGKDVIYRGAQGTAIAKVFDMVVAATGKSERALRTDGADVLSCVTFSGSHAGYYPGATPLVLKLVFGKDGRLFGAQVIGKAGVDKRIDVLATALRLGATVQQIADLELAYAPPFGGAKDAVNIAGYVASNIVEGDLEVAGWQDVLQRDSGTLLLDVRDRKEWDEGHIEGAIHIPLTELRQRLDEIPPQSEVIVYCRMGQRGWAAARILEQNQIRARNLSGGWVLFKQVIDDLEAS